MHSLAPASSLALFQTLNMDNDFHLFQIRPRVAEQCDFDIDHDRFKWNPIGQQVRNSIGKRGLKDVHGWYGVFKTYAGDKRLPSRHLPFYRPSNPRTDTQQVTRNTFKDGAAAWRALTPEQKQVYNARGRRRRVTGYNDFMSAYLSLNQ